MIVLHFRCLRMEKFLFQKSNHLVGVIHLYFLHLLLVLLVQVLSIMPKFVLDKKLEVDWFFSSIVPPCYSIPLDLFLEKPFYEEALDLTRGYKPIIEKLVEPLQPLQIDPTSKFNAISPLGAQVSFVFLFFLLLFFYYYSINIRINETHLEVQRTESYFHSR